MQVASIDRQSAEQPGCYAWNVPWSHFSPWSACTMPSPQYGQLGAGTWLAAPTGFRLAGGTAAIARIGRVASFAGLDVAIATHERRNALLPGKHLYPGVLRFAVCRTPRAALIRPWSQTSPGFTTPSPHLNAHDARQTMGRIIGIDGANMVGFDFAQPVASVDCLSIPVGPLFAANFGPQPKDTRRLLSKNISDNGHAREIGPIRRSFPDRIPR